MSIRQISEEEKEIVKQNQTDTNGTLRCFISGEIIGPNDEVEYDHINAFSQKGASDIVNVKVVLKKYNRRKSDQSLLDVREKFQLEKLFDQKNNNVKLQDILSFKKIEHENIDYKISSDETCIEIFDSMTKYDLPLFYDKLLDAKYFYGQIPVKWISNDDQEGLQPRIIDKKRLYNLKIHLSTHPQLAPAIARLKDNSILLFDGQHKTAAQLLNDAKYCDCKVFISPKNPTESKKLFDQLMMTNLDAHSKLRQVPFYTSTLVERFSVIYKELWEEFTDEVDSSKQSEHEFLMYLMNKKNMTKEQAKTMISSWITEAALANSELTQYIAEASKDTNFPISQDILKKAIFPNCLYTVASHSIFDSPNDFRNDEVSNFKDFSKILLETSHLVDWVPTKNGQLTQEQIRARRIWHKGSILTWGPMLKDILINSCNMITEDERNKLLYRKSLTADQCERIRSCLTRIFDNPLWISPDSTIDSLLSSSTKQIDLFERFSLTTTYALTGNA